MLLLSRDRAIQVREFVIVAEVTRTIRHIPVEVPLGPEDGLPAKCVVNLDVINTIPKKILVQYISTISPTKMNGVDQALEFSLGLS